MQPAHRCLTIGVVADTHVPDRINALHPALLASLKAAGVERILHAGDACTNRVPAELAQVAPVSLVRGNRDWTMTPLPPDSLSLDLFGNRLVLAHGHGSFFTYWYDKFQYIRHGYVFERYQRRLLRGWPQANVFVFGHTHHAEIRWIDGRLYFNPGSASFGLASIQAPMSFGLLRAYPDGRIEAEICPLDGWRPVQGRWMRA